MTKKYIDRLRHLFSFHINLLDILRFSCVNKVTRFTSLYPAANPAFCVEYNNFLCEPLHSNIIDRINSIPVLSRI